MPSRNLILVVAMFAVGCQSAKHDDEMTVTLTPSSPVEEAVAASALVFDPPVAQGEEPLALGRVERQPGVSVGYEDLTAEYFSIRTDDRQIFNGGGYGSRSNGRYGGSGNYDRFERRAVTERVGVRYR